MTLALAAFVGWSGLSSCWYVPIAAAAAGQHNSNNVLVAAAAVGAAVLHKVGQSQPANSTEAEQTEEVKEAKAGGPDPHAVEEAKQKQAKKDAKAKKAENAERKLVTLKPRLPHPGADNKDNWSTAMKFYDAGTFEKAEEADADRLLTTLEKASASGVQMSAYLRGMALAANQARFKGDQGWMQYLKERKISHSTAQRRICFYDTCRKYPGLLAVQGAWSLASEKPKAESLVRAIKADEKATKTRFWCSQPAWADAA
jgi:hypothetical protein